jgi:hypothetical protein
LRCYRPIQASDLADAMTRPYTDHDKRESLAQAASAESQNKNPRNTRSHGNVVR